MKQKFETLTDVELQNTTGGKGDFFQGLFDGFRGPKKKNKR